MTRTFESSPAVRQRTPLLIGIVSPSGAGKTYSALRLAAGIQRVSEGPVYFIDTENKRGLHYADKFKFNHLNFAAPFAPLDYLAAIEHCVSKGARTIIIDSCSHEHEGPGGVLEMHEAEIDRLCRDDKSYAKREKMTMLAWQKPKAQRRRLINTMLQMDCNFILNFRAKEKLKLAKGEDPKPLGWMPIAGPEFVYEMTVKLLFLPGGNGVPVLQSDFDGERSMIKIPEQFRGMFDPARPRQVDESLGEQLARWAAGTIEPSPAAQLVERYRACTDAAAWAALEADRRLAWAKTPTADKAALKAAADEAHARIEAIAAEAALGGKDGAP